MGFARKSLIVVLTPLLVILLLGAALDFGILHVAGNAQTVEKTLASSGIYNDIISNALNQAQKSVGSANQVALNDPTVKSAAEQTFTPQVVQQYTEQAINGVYAWLNGKSPQPDFSIDLTQLKLSFAQKVGQAAEQRAHQLPACTSAPTTTDPLSITCLPHGVTPTQVRVQATSAVLTSQGFLENPVITSAGVKKSGTNQSVFATGKAQSAPKQFQRAKKAPVILTVLAILIMVAIIFLSSSRRNGLRRVGFVLIATGVLLLLLVWGLNTVNNKAITKIQLDNKVLQTDAQKLATSLIQNTEHSYQDFGGVYVVAGILAVGGTLLAGRGFKKGAGPDATSSGNTDPKNGAATSQPAYKVPQKSKKAPTKIQG